MKKVLQLFGIGIIVCALLLVCILFFVRISSESGSVTTDVLGLSVPQPPAWTSYVPYLGSAIGALYEMFSLHGLVVVGILVLLIPLGSFFISISTSDMESDSKSKPTSTY